MFLYNDWTFIIIIPALLIAGWAQMKVKSTFNKFSKVTSINRYTGAQVARMLLDSEGLYDIPVEQVDGKLTDHYNPKDRIMRLSREVYLGNSVAAIGIAAHETGHAIQHQKRYIPLQIRSSIVPVVNFSSNVSWILFIFGLMFGSGYLINIGIILFISVVLFQMVTLPVEFNASRRALEILESKNILYGEELKGAKAVLSAAAMTYVAAAITAVLQLIRLVLLSRDR